MKILLLILTLGVTAFGQQTQPSPSPTSTPTPPKSAQLVPHTTVVVVKRGGGSISGLFAGGDPNSISVDVDGVRVSILLSDVNTISFGAGGGAGVSTTTVNANISGKWNMTANADGQVVPVVLEFKQEGESISGALSSPIGNATIGKVAVTGNSYTGTGLLNLQGQEMEITITGTVEGNNMKGTITGAAIPQVTFTAVKEKWVLQAL